MGVGRKAQLCGRVLREAVAEFLIARREAWPSADSRGSSAAVESGVPMERIAAC